jgi:catechol 2,3-dioxygenase-like lactoylglutathione lyase family enzyme
MIRTAPPKLLGVHHTARPTWKLEETVHFYRDILGLPLVHCLAPKGWGPDNHPDFLHFFFDAGNGAAIAFFYYLGEIGPPPDLQPPARLHHQRATHTAWNCGTREELLHWKQRLADHGVSIIYHIAHEVVESIYFHDPNGYYIEIGFPVRPFNDIDARDSETTIRAAIDVDRALRAKGSCASAISSIWSRKGELVEEFIGQP